MNSNRLIQNFVAFAVGLIFSVGLALAGMTQPQKIIGFLNLSNWDPSLIFVMLGAVGVHTVSYKLIRKRTTPLFDTTWHVPTRNDVTPRLLLGAAIFGAGWGLAGFCPGPAMTSLASGDARVFLFVISMLGGMLVLRKTEPYLKLRG